MFWTAVIAILLIPVTAPANTELHVVNIDRSAVITITFDGPVDPADATAAPLRVFTAQGALVPCSFGATGPNALTLTPDDPLPPGTQITVHVPVGFAGSDGAILTKAYQWNFWTASSQTDLQYQTELIHAGRQPFALACGDYENNGTMDLVVIEGAALHECVLYTNSGGGSFTEVQRISIAENPVHAVSGDFDLDGNLDLAVAHWNGQQVSILLGDGSGTLSDPIDYPLGASSHKLACGDLDGDGYPELVSANRLEGSLSILRNDGDGSFSVDPPTTLGTGTRDVCLDDWDQDGDLDIVVASIAEGYGIHLNDGDGAFTWFNEVFSPNPSPTNAPAYAACYLYRPDEPILYGFSEGSPSYLITNYTTAHGVEMGEYADYPIIAETDGWFEPDLVYVDYLSGYLVVVRSVASWASYSHFFAFDHYAPPSSDLGDIRNPLVADFDGDGDTDIVTAYRSGGAVYLWRNESIGELPALSLQRFEVQPPDGLWADSRALIEVAPDGTIHCIYGTYTYGTDKQRLIHSVFGSQWVHTDLGPFAECTPGGSMSPFWTSMDPSGLFHVAYEEPYSSGIAWYMTWNDGVWTREPLPLHGELTMVRSSGHPPMVFVVRGDSIYSMELLDGAWETDLVQVIPEYHGRPMRLAADRSPDGTTYLAFAEMDYGLPLLANYPLYVGSRVGGDWHFRKIDESLWGLHGLRVSPSRGPFVAYSRDGNSGAPRESRIARLIDGQWTTEYYERGPTGCSECPSAFGISPTGDPWIIGSHDAFVRDLEKWQSMPIDGYQSWGGIAFDADGHPWISNVESGVVAIYTTSSRDLATSVDPHSSPSRVNAVHLGEAVPNPFNPSTTITYSIPVAQHVELEIYDVAGRHVRTLVSGIVIPVEHQVPWNGIDDTGTQVASGVYLYQLRTRDFVETKRMVLLK